VNLVAILCILSWRIFWITMLNRTSPRASPNEAFTELDQYILDELLPDKHPAPREPSIAHYVLKLARLGGYLARAHDRPPGNTVIWRGLSRLSDIELGIMIRSSTELWVIERNFGRLRGNGDSTHTRGKPKQHGKPSACHTWARSDLCGGAN
jgi:hypothetical protein